MGGDFVTKGLRDFVQLFGSESILAQIIHIFYSFSSSQVYTFDEGLNFFDEICL